MKNAQDCTSPRTGADRTLLYVVLFLLSWHVAVGEERLYPLTIKLLETKHITSTSSGSKVDTNCTQNPWNNDVNCNSQQVGGGQSVIFESTVEASDGNTYEIQCVTPFRVPFSRGNTEALTARKGAGPASYGCQMQPDTYQARQEKGRLKVLVFNSNGKSMELTFAILSSKPTPSLRSAETQATPSTGSEKTTLKIMSTPPGAEIELDGSFVGSTPSTLVAGPGDHSVKVSKSGFKPWERKFKTTGGEVTIAAELETEQK